MNICKSKHGEYSVHLNMYRGSMYARFKKCSICDVFLKYDGVVCPCCGVRLRTHPKGQKSKIAFSKHLTSMSMEDKN